MANIYTYGSSNAQVIHELKTIYDEFSNGSSVLIEQYRKDIEKNIDKIISLLRQPSNSLEDEILTTRISAIKILIVLTSPQDDSTDLLKIKEKFNDYFVTKTIVDHIKFTIEYHSHEHDYSVIQDSILLLCNILHLPETYANKYYINIKNQIMWNLFAEGFDKIIIYLTSQKIFAKTVVQLLALLYKHQHVGTLQKLLNCWLESSLSESSDGSHTMQQERFSTMNLSEFGDENNNDYNDKKNHRNTTLKEKDFFNSKSDSDFGYVTQLELENKDEELFCFTKTLTKNDYGNTFKYNTSRKSQILKQRNKDMNDVLKEFTVDFLLKGYNDVVRDLRLEYFENNFDPTHLFWLNNYFLKFAPLIDLDLEYINNVLSTDTLSFLVFHGIKLIDETKISASSNLKAGFIKLHLIIRSINEFFEVIHLYKNNVSLNANSRCHIYKLEKEISEMRDLGSLLWLLMQNFDENLQSKMYLKDLIIANNNYLMFADRHNSLYNDSFNTFEYLKRFATCKIMSHYGYLLQGFKENGKYVNDCIFTIMHHVAGDLQSASALLQKNILDTFRRILKSDFEFCDDWMDLMKYVVNEWSDKYRGELANKEKERLLTEVLENIEEEKIVTDFSSLKDLIIKEYYEHILWIQGVLLKIYYIKFLHNNPDLLKTNASVSEAIIYNNLAANLPVPLVPNNLAQQSILKNSVFAAFLQSLGFQKSETEFFAVPNFWTSSHLLATAELLGPLHKHLKFELSICNRVTNTGKLRLSTECVTPKSNKIDDEKRTEFNVENEFSNILKNIENVHVTD